MLSVSYTALCAGDNMFVPPVPSSTVLAVLDSPRAGCGAVNPRWARSGLIRAKRVSNSHQLVAQYRAPYIKKGCVCVPFNLVGTVCRNIGGICLPRVTHLRDTLIRLSPVFYGAWCKVG